MRYEFEGPIPEEEFGRSMGRSIVTLRRDRREGRSPAFIRIGGPSITPVKTSQSGCKPIGSHRFAPHALTLPSQRNPKKNRRLAPCEL
jgi:hypothetical protein